MTTNPSDLGRLAEKSSPDYLMRRLADLEAKVRRMETARSLEAATIGRGGLRSANFDGTMDPPAVGTNGWALTGEDIIIAGNLFIGGNLIGDDALAHPTKVAIAFADVNNANFTVAGANLAPASVTVPAGFTTAQVLCIANIGDSRTATGGASPLYGQAWVGKSGGGTTGSAVIGGTCQGGSSLPLTMGWASVLTGLHAGDVVQGGAWAAVDTTTGWTSGGGNAHSVVAVTFYR